MAIRKVDGGTIMLGETLDLVAANCNRLIGDMPRIGIRPTIDGRRDGVRESLEKQTSWMACTAAGLLIKKLRHSNGLPVECVIPDYCIGGATEAAMVEDLFSRHNVGITLTVTSCWCYGSETMDMNPLRPKAVWGFNGTERPGAVYLAAVLAAYAQKGLPAFGIYGHDVKDAGDQTIPADVEKKLLRFAKAGLTVATTRDKSYLSMGGCSMGIAGSIVDRPFFENFLGMRVEEVDMVEFVRRIEKNIYDPKEFEKALRWVKDNCKEGKDYNGEKTHTRQQKDKGWEMVVKMTMIARDLMFGNDKLDDLGFGEEGLGHNAILSGFQGQRHWTDHFPNGDFLEAILNSSFDWNGIREAVLVATENDSLNGVCMLMGHLLTNTAQIFADVRTYWSPDAVKRVSGYQLEGLAEGGFIHLINSGAATLDATGDQKIGNKPAMKPFWEITQKEAQACLDSTRWSPAIVEYFRGGGYSSSYLTKGQMPVTMMRLNLIKGLGPTLQLAEGWTTDLPEQVAKVVEERTNPTWPTHWFVPRLTGVGPFRDVYSVMNNWGANHGAVSYGHIGADLITLCSMLRIPVAMHNVPESDIFRPSAWGAFGAMDPQSADYRACATYKSLYGI